MIITIMRHLVQNKNRRTGTFMIVLISAYTIYFVVKNENIHMLR